MAFSAEAIPFAALSVATFATILVLCRYYLPVPPMILAAKATQTPRAYQTMRWEYLSNWGALVHAVLTSILSLVALNFYYPEPETVSTVFVNFVIALSLGYFIVDTVGGYLFGYNDALMQVHHLLALYMSLYLLWADRYGVAYLYILVIGELNNPALILRKNLEKHQAGKIWGIVLGLVYSISFLILRGYVACLYMPRLMSHPLSITFKIALAFLWYFSLYWCYTIINFMVKGFRTELGWHFLDPVQEGLNKIRGSRAMTVLLHAGLLVVSFRYLFIPVKPVVV